MDIDQNENIIARYVQNPMVLDEPISIKTLQGKFYYLFDGLGSVTGLTDTGGNLVATYKYDAFGNIVSETGDETLNSLNPYRFTSRVYDKETGLYYYRARYYDSKTGRFTQKDPLREVMQKGNNLYVYVGNNPVNWVDPTGLYTVGWVCTSYGCYTWHWPYDKPWQCVVLKWVFTGWWWFTTWVNPGAKRCREAWYANSA
jgi:RHS repeat-associated protein